MSGLALRLSAAPGQGLGHVTRCSVLAEQFEGSIFVTSHEGRQTLLGQGLAPNRIEVMVPDEPPTGWLTRRADVRRVIVDTLHAGNAAATEAEVAALVRAGLSVTVIDSMPPDHFAGSPDPSEQPDLVVTPYLGADRLRPPPLARCWLTGARLAVLPPAITAARTQPYPRVPCILVACGGADPDGLSAQAAAILARGAAPVDVIVGPGFAPDLVVRLEEIAAAHPGVRLHASVTNPVPLYLAATLVVGRPGLLRYEVAVLGRQGVYFWDGADYLDYFRNFAAAGLAEIHFGTDPGGWDGFRARLAELTDAATLRQMSHPNRAAQMAVDGTGAAAIAAAIRAPTDGDST